MGDSYGYWFQKYTDKPEKMKAESWFVNWNYCSSRQEFEDYQKLALWWDNNVEGRYLGES